MIYVDKIVDFVSWRNQARFYLQSAINPADINWNEEQTSLFGNEKIAKNSCLSNQTREVFLPKDFFNLAQLVACSNDPLRWSLLYRIAYRICYENKHLLLLLTDVDVRSAYLIEKSVKKDIHKMHAFVRFKECFYKDKSCYLAWYRPEHFITRLAAPFFVRRFADRPWIIFTPWDSALWNLSQLQFGQGMQQADFRIKDNMDELWKTFYRSVFNPARLKIKMMKSEMPVKYWSSLPESSLILDLIRNSPARVQSMIDENKNKQASNMQIRPVSQEEFHIDDLQKRKKDSGAFGEIMILLDDKKHFDTKASESIMNKISSEFLLKKESEYLTSVFKNRAQPLNDKDMSHLKLLLEKEIETLRPKMIYVSGRIALITLLGFLPTSKQDRQKEYSKSCQDFNYIVKILK